MINVVVAEDNPGDVFLIRRALSAEGLAYNIVLAKDGAEAIRYVYEAAVGDRRIDILLLDLNLPKRSGVKVLEELRLHEELKQIPVIVLTSSDSPEDKRRCMRLGANRYLLKPSNLASFMEIGKITTALLRDAH